MLKKNLSKALVVGGIVVLMFTAMLAGNGSLGTAAAQSETSSAENRGALNVTGSAVVTGSPDIAYITLGVETKDQSAETASQDNANRMAAVMAALKKMGLKDSDISTSGYNIYSYQQQIDRTLPTEQMVTVYTVQNRINITTKQLDQVGKIIDAAVKAGANQVQGINFDIEDKQELQLLALENATKQAKIKADAMAKAAGVTLGGLTTIQEEYATYAPMNEAMTLRAASFKAADTAITPGDVEISARVNAEFWF